MRYAYRNDLTELARLASDLEAFAEQHQLDGEMAHVFNLCLDELFTNIVSYGFGDELPHEIILEMTATPAEVCAVLRDDARAFNPLTEAPAPDLDAPIEDRRIGGLGVHFVKQLMTRVSYRREGACNVLELARARGASRVASV